MANKNTLTIGWYEFIKPKGTTHVVHVGESTYYFPEEGVSLDDFSEAIAAQRVYRLIRVTDIEEELRKQEMSQL